MLNPGDRVDERYEVQSLLGQGGLAEVYLVRHVDLGSPHALKVLMWNNDKLAERLLLEGRIQAQLRHPNVVSVTDVVRHQGRLALLMEYVDNVSLEDFLHERGALPVDDALELFAAILSGVAAAHEAGVLHRDLKPANVLLAQTARGIVPKVADFGIAKVVAEQMGGMTRTGSMMGTPGYMAPEQVLDAASADARVDVFALGAILYEMLSGDMAFADPTGEVQVKATLEGRFTPLRDRVAEVPEGVAVAVHTALARDRDDRFADVTAFATALFADRADLLQLVVGNQAARSLSIDPASGGARSITDRARASNGETLEPSPQPRRPTSAETLAGFTEDEEPAPRRSVLPWVGLGAIVLLATVLGIGVIGAWMALGPEDAPRVSSALDVDRAARPPAAPTEPSEPPPAGLVATPPAASGTTVPVPGPIQPTEPVAAQPVADAPGSPRPDAPAPDAPTVPEPTVPAEPTTAVAPAPPGPGPASGTAAPKPPPEPDAPAPAAVATPPRLAGVWAGTASGRPFQLAFLDQSGGRIDATATFFLGPSQRTAALSGTVGPDGKVVLQEAGGGLSLTGTLASGELRGTYTQGRKALPFEVRESR